MLDKKMTTAEAASFIGFSEGTLENWRTKDKGPAYYNPEGKVFYLEGDLVKWLLESKKEPEQ